MKNKIINECLNNIVDATFQLQGGHLGPRQLGAIADIRENVATIKDCIEDCIEDNCQPENNFLQCQINIMNKRLDCLTAKLQQLVEEYENGR